MEARDEALDKAKKSGLPGAWNGKQDAFRHCLWNCLMAQKMGSDNARKWGDAHEQSSEIPAETKMDLYNNQIGRQLGNANPGEDCACLCRNALNAGKLRYFNNKNNAVADDAELIPTNLPSAPFRN